MFVHTNFHECVLNRKCIAYFYFINKKNPVLFSFFLQKQNDIHSFNIDKNVKDESANKLTTSKLIAYNDKMTYKQYDKLKVTEILMYSDLRCCHPNH